MKYTTTKPLAFCCNAALIYCRMSCGKRVFYSVNTKVDRASDFRGIATESMRLYVDVILYIYMRNYCAVDKIEKNEMGWACGAYG